MKVIYTGAKQKKRVIISLRGAYDFEKGKPTEVPEHVANYLLNVCGAVFTTPEKMAKRKKTETNVEPQPVNNANNSENASGVERGNNANVTEAKEQNIQGNNEPKNAEVKEKNKNKNNKKDKQ